VLNLYAAVRVWRFVGLVFACCMRVLLLLSLVFTSECDRLLFDFKHSLVTFASKIDLLFLSLEIVFQQFGI
jgi:hypothetical protein